MHTKLTTYGFVLLSIVSCKILKPSANKFIAYDQYLMRFDILMRKVHNDQWNIAYRYGDDCPEEKRGNAKALEQAMTTAMQLWLQPVRDLKTTKPIVNDFRYKKNADLSSTDMRVTFHCVGRQSNASIHNMHPPDVSIREGTMVNNQLMSVLVHEIGHSFGMADTYLGSMVRDTTPTTAGGLSDTVGTQPPSIMSFHLGNFYYANGDKANLGEDDKRGIIWLYKFLYESLNPKDCFFSDYVLEKDPLGCRPKYPLIFEVKHGLPWLALKLLNEDPKIDVNVQDPNGMTALHHAALLDRKEVVQRLLEHKDIKPGLKDKQGRTALDIAREENLTEMIALLQAVTPQKAVEDVNGDGIVNILDLVVVANNFGKKGKNIADVDGNGVVDIRDLVRVASAFGNNAASAPLHPEVAKLVTSAKVYQWLIAARQQPSADPTYQRGILVLEQLLTRTTPQQTILLANYPNPFNPETWLPYQLAKPAKVMLLIHAADGKLVRKMALGDLPAGVYQSKSRAAHWDGRNAHGEPAASGIYFYTLSAGDVTATRKMMLRK